MSQFNVSRFQSALKNGGARPNQFSVSLAFPAAVPGGIQAAGLAPFLVNIAELPGTTINPAIIQYRGREVKFAGDRIYAPYTITVLNDTDMTIRNAMENWVNTMENNFNKRGFTTPSNYSGDITIKQLSRNSTDASRIREYKLLGAFPIDISPVGLDFGANDQISQFTVTFQYQYFTYSLGVGSPAAAQQNPGVADTAL